MAVRILNYALFQAGWLACVIGAARGWPMIGLLSVAPIVAMHLRLARQPWREAALLGLCALIGGAYDSLLLATGWIEYPNGQWIPGLAPYWIVALWILFGTTLSLSLQWLRGRVLLAALLGAIGAPLSYLGGAELGAMTLSQPAAAMMALAAGWAILMPALASLSARLDGFAGSVLPPLVQAGWNGLPQTLPAPPARRSGGRAW